MNRSAIFVCVTGVAFLSTSVNTDAWVLFDWTFESSYTSITGASADLGPIAADLGSGLITGHHASSATVWSSPTGNGSSHSLAANNWSVGDYFQFRLDAAGFSAVVLDWDQASSNTGPRDFVLQYSTDNSTYTQFDGTLSVLANASIGTRTFWTTGNYQSDYHFSLDLSAVSAIENQSTVYFRLVDNSNSSANGASVSTSGTSRIDNFTFVVPEPSTLVLVSLGFAALLANRRRT